MDKAIKILEQEIAWYQKNPDKAPGASDDWTNGFIEGCKHCLALLVKCEDAVLTSAMHSDGEGRCKKFDVLAETIRKSDPFAV